MHNQIHFPTGLENLTLPKRHAHQLRLALDAHPRLGIGIYVVSVLTLFTASITLNPGHWPIQLALSNLAALCMTTIGLLIRRQYDGLVRNREQLAQLLPYPVLGIAPLPPAHSGALPYALYTSQEPDSYIATAFHTLSQNLQQLTAAQPLKVLNVTSTDASEGKSSTTINLATAFAQQGQRVLLVDADLRRPTLHQHFHLEDNTCGLSHYLAELSELADVIQPTFEARLFLIPAGAITPQPVELLSSERLSQLIAYIQEANSPYDLLLIDSPPIKGLADAMLISNRVQHTLLIVAAQQTKQAELLSSHERLLQTQTQILGTVLTKC